MKLYREVQCSDRLPELKDKEQGVSDWVLCYWKDTDDWGETFYDYGNEMWDGNNDPTFWLEPYDLPTEEEIEEEAYKRYGDGPDVLSSQQWKAFKRGAKWITNLLKGER